MCLLDSVWIFRWEDWKVPGCDLARGSWSDWGGGSTPRMTALLVWCLGWAGVKAQLPCGRWLEDSTRTSSPQSWAFHSMAVSRDWVLQMQRQRIGFCWARLRSLSHFCRILLVTSQSFFQPIVDLREEELNSTSWEGSGKVTQQKSMWDEKCDLFWKIQSAKTYTFWEQRGKLNHIYSLFGD